MYKHVLFQLKYNNAYLPFKACTFFVLLLKKRQNASPPIPVLEGSVTLRAAATATAASAAFPPDFSMPRNRGDNV